MQPMAAPSSPREVLLQSHTLLPAPSPSLRRVYPACGGGRARRGELIGTRSLRCFWQDSPGLLADPWLMSETGAISGATGSPGNQAARRSWLQPINGAALAGARHRCPATPSLQGIPRGCRNSAKGERSETGSPGYRDVASLLYTSGTAFT